MKPQVQTKEELVEKLKTEEAVSLVKTTFEHQLKQALNLHKISAPLVLLDGTGVNDDLNGVERIVRFPMKCMQEQSAGVVQSLAKWKRIRLAEYEMDPGQGIITDMRALRADEDLGPLHSIYVDQWDWEKVIFPENRTLEFLQETVEKIYAAMRETEQTIAAQYPEKPSVLPDRITFVHAEDLLREYPDLTPKEREDRVAEEFGTVFLMGVGAKLSNGDPHDGRAPDYDDWSTENSSGHYGLNGDILVWNPVLGQAFEISSMGIRVDAETLERQLEITGHEERKQLFYHQKLLNGHLPQTIGGGIGQSRLCMFMLKKRHIGEVQVGIWPEALKRDCEEKGIALL